MLPQMDKQTNSQKNVAGPTIQSLAPERVRPMALARKYTATFSVIQASVVFFYCLIVNVFKDLCFSAIKIKAIGKNLKDFCQNYHSQLGKAKEYSQKAFATL